MYIYYLILVANFIYLIKFVSRCTSLVAILSSLRFISSRTMFQFIVGNFDPSITARCSIDNLVSIDRVCSPPRFFDGYFWFVLFTYFFGYFWTRKSINWNARDLEFFSRGRRCSRMSDLLRVSRGIGARHQFAPPNRGHSCGRSSMKIIKKNKEGRKSNEGAS